MLPKTLPDLNALDRETLQSLLLAEHEERIAINERLLSRESEIEHLKLLIAKLRRMQFGRRSEKIERQIEQLELRLEDLEVKRAVANTTPSESTSPTNPLPAAKPARRPLPDHLPRQIQKHEPAETVCPDCGGVLCRLGKMSRRCWSMCRRAFK